MCFYFITGTRLFEGCFQSAEGSIEVMQRRPREYEARYLRFKIQRPANLIYTPHLFAHAVLTVDTGSPTFLSGWDAATISNQSIIHQMLDQNTLGVRRGKWREIFRNETLSTLGKWVFSPSTGPQESEDKQKKHWKYCEQHS